MSELETKVQKSLERLRLFCPEEGYYLAFSGGKDSVVCKALLDMSGCKYDATYRATPKTRRGPFGAQRERTTTKRQRKTCGTGGLNNKEAQA